MGCVNLREDAVDWYIRSRHDLLKSSLDGFDYDLSVANFAFSKLNLNRHGYNLEKSTEDLLCDSIILKELGGDVLQEIALLEHQLKTKDIPQEKQFEILDEISRLEEKLRTTEHITDDTTRTTEMIRGAEQKLSAHPHSGRMKELELKDISSSWPDMDVAPDKHYSEAHVFHKQHHPLRGMNSRTGRNHMIEKNSQFLFTF